MPDATGKAMVIPDYDRDSIHTLPLMSVPIENPGLRRARLIRNVRLESRIELFRESGVGSGQIAIDEIPDFFGDKGQPVVEDVKLIKRLGSLPAFDPYSLRIGLRQAGIDLIDADILQLSPAKKSELFPLMRQITRPLIAHLYGNKKIDPSNTQALLEAIARPDARRVRVKLHKMAAALGIPLDALPDLLEDYGDTYLALSYYRSYFLHMVPLVDRLVDWISDVQSSSVITRDGAVVKNMKQTQDVLTHVTESVRARFEGFDQRLEIRWDKIEMSQFSAIRALIQKHQQTLAEVLCGLTVKVFEWEQVFPSGGGSPEKRADFVATQLRPGLDRIWAIERRAPTFE
jgi:hypothetical protein